MSSYYYEALRHTAIEAVRHTAMRPYDIVYWYDAASKVAGDGRIRRALAAYAP